MIITELQLGMRVLILIHLAIKIPNVISTFNNVQFLCDIFVLAACTYYAMPNVFNRSTTLAKFRCIIGLEKPHIEGLERQRAICILAILRKLALKIFCCTVHTDSQTVFLVVFNCRTFASMGIITSRFLVF